MSEESGEVRLDANYLMEVLRLVTRSVLSKQEAFRPIGDIWQ